MNDGIAEAYLKILEGRVLEMAMPITRSVGDLDAASEQTLYKNLAAKHSNSKMIKTLYIHPILVDCPIRKLLVGLDFSIFTKSFLKMVGEIPAEYVKKSPMFPFFQSKANRLNAHALFGELDTYMDLPNGCTFYLSLVDRETLRSIKVEDTETKEVLIDWNFEEIS